MGSTKCISEDIKINAMTVGKYSVVNPSDGYPLPDSHKITVKVKKKNLIQSSNPSLICVEFAIICCFSDFLSMN